MRDSDFVARLHRNFALLGGQLKTRLKTQLKNHMVLGTALALFAALLLVIPFYGCSPAASENTQGSSTAQSEAQKDQKEEAPKGTVKATSFYSPTLGLDWNYDVYLPADYESNPDKTYPVIYMLHGLYGNHRNLLERFDSSAMLDEAIQTAGQGAIVVFVDGFNSFYIDSADRGLKMESAIMNDLVPYIESTYRVSKDRKDHAIGGISMGGYGAARFVLHHSDYFSKGILLSPSVWTTLADDNFIYTSQHAFSDGTTSWSWNLYKKLFPTQYLGEVDPSQVSFFVATTSDDGVVPVADVDAFVEQLKNAGINVDYQRDSGDNHNWKYWSRVAPTAYAWALDQFKSADSK